MTNHIIQAIDQQYIAANSGKSLCPIRVSSFGDCTAKLYQLASGASREELNARTYRIFEVGHDRGSRLADQVSRSHGWIQSAPEQEVRVPIVLPAGVAKRVHERMEKMFGSNDLPVMIKHDKPDTLYIRGRADLVLYGQDHDCEVVEFKTKNSFGFDKLDSEGPGLQYTLQVYGYIVGLRELGNNPTRATFVFENKDNCELHAIELNFDEAKRLYDEWMVNFKLMLEQLANDASADELPRSVVPTHIYETVRNAQLNDNITAKLPWNCNYCAAGPTACIKWCNDSGIAVDILDKRRSGADKPAYMVTIR